MTVKSHIVVMQEGASVGVPTWRFAASRVEGVVVHAPARLALDEEGNVHNDSSFVSKLVRQKCLTWRRTFSHQLASVGFPFDEPFALYVPIHERDLNFICAASQTWGGCIQAVSPFELEADQLTQIALAWTSTSRRIRYLCEHNLCERIDVPWLHLLTPYSFNPSITLFLASSVEIVEQYRLLCKQVVGCSEIDLKETIRAEQADWVKNYQAFESRELSKYWNPRR